MTRSAPLGRQWARQTLPVRERDRLYRQVDGHLGPTREPRQRAEAQGYREAKAGLAFSAHDVAEVSKERHAILPKILRAQVTDSETFRTSFAEVSQQARGAQAAEGIVLADGARWIWGMVEEQLPHAVQILDCSPPDSQEIVMRSGVDPPLCCSTDRAVGVGA